MAQTVSLSSTPTINDQNVLEREGVSSKVEQEIEREVLTRIQEQKRAWETGHVFVTKKVSFQIQDLMETLKKNYIGIFNNPKDPHTGRNKIWIPLTESIVDAVVKNIDLDTKDINFRAKQPDAMGLTSLIRNITKNNLDEISFGEKLDELERCLSVYGTAVWKTLEMKDEQGKSQIDIARVDLFNFYIDPSAESIQTSDVIERSLLTQMEFDSMDGWENKEGVQAQTGLSRVSDRLRQTQLSSQTKMIEVFEWWGEMPKFWLTGNKEDKKKTVPGHIVLTGLNTNGARLHLIEKNTAKGGLKPYEEVHYGKIDGRWLGRGPAEKSMMLQIWLNTVVNIRIARSYVSQLGIFKIKKGSGVTPQMMSRLAANGAVVVRNQDDIEQFVMQEASQASYTDESVINDWASRVTSVFESVTGEALPASTSATGAAIQRQAGQSQFTFIKETIGLFLQRWLKRHALPILQKRITPDEVLRVTGEVDEIREIDERVVNYALYMEIEKLNKKGKFVTPELVEETRAKLTEQLKAQGKDRWIKLTDKIDVSKYDVQVFVTNEEVDKGVLVQNLNATLQMVGAIPGIDVDPADIVRQIFDVLGLDVPKKRQTPQLGTGQELPPELAALAGQQGQVPTAPPTGNFQQVETEGVTLQQGQV